jgi:hypothetical protein
LPVDSNSTWSFDTTHGRDKACHLTFMMTSFMAVLMWVH